MDYTNKWLKVYVIPNQEAPAVADVLVTNFCHFGVLREMHSVWAGTLSPDFCRELCNAWEQARQSAALHLQSVGMVEKIYENREEHQRKVT
jgi:hypothetical protein